MKKVLISLTVIMFVLLIGYGFSYAISGVCYNCHTMHASQNGTLMGDGPHPYLLLYTCIGCHSGPGTAKTNATTSAPNVLYTSGCPASAGSGSNGQGAAVTIAGGNFCWVKNGSDALGHNVADIGVGMDVAIGANITRQPPGWDSGVTDPAGNAIADATWTQQLTCAGQFGCHGKHTVVGSDAGIFGSHHSNTGGTHTVATAPDATKPGTGFRFLAGIKGMEETDWEWSETTALHNEYYGIDDTSARVSGSASTTDGTISQLCAECHGKFHSQIDDATTLGTPWLRHPTDIVLDRGAGTEYSAYNGSATPPTATYALDAPVARGAVPSTPSSVVTTNVTTTTGAIVMCMSCHRAHGSPQADLLRWNYTEMTAGTGGTTGCFRCHTTK